MSEATQPLTRIGDTVSEASKLQTVPRELLGPPGDFNPTLLMFLAAVGMAVLSITGYWC